MIQDFPYRLGSLPLFTEENFERLKELPGDMHEKMNAAIELYLRSPNDKERG